VAVILIADDDEGIRAWTSYVLKSAGHDVLTACNGLEEVSLYRSNPDRIDVVLTDLTMPVMDGSQAVKLIRQTRPSARIAYMSGYTAAGVPGGTAFLEKPFTAEMLRACVDELLADQKRTPESGH
jgi:CheY-like chemotaxis protein